MRASSCIVLLTMLSMAVDEPKPGTALPKPKLWAGMTVTSPAIDADYVADARHFMVSFALVNDDNKGFAPTAEVNSSKFFINGKELEDWPHIISNGPREVRGFVLESGKSLQFTKGMGKYFAEPGTYKIKWSGKAFESAETIFRVLPGRGR